MTLVVHGELAGNVKDADRGLSQKLLAVMESRRQGRHIHVVDAAGYSDLLFGAPAVCRSLKMQGAGVTVVAEVGDGVFGGPFDRIGLRNRGVGLADGRLLGRGTPGHEKLLARLVERVLGHRLIEARAPARRGPQFDIGWVGGRTAYGAWAVSPAQLRGDGASPIVDAILHIGTSLRGFYRPGTFQPVVVVDDGVQMPSAPLDRAASSAGILLSRTSDLSGGVAR
ncbi:hypothetical protein [Kitasatospora sp. NPDC094015]|uniref:hypothetical protein n=1 Tax=Kitasatospora sp. NPDC094015 TaxID=3155205 RepID=UPI0033262AE5